MEPEKKERRSLLGIIAKEVGGLLKPDESKERTSPGTSPGRQGRTEILIGIPGVSGGFSLSRLLKGQKAWIHKEDFTSHPKAIDVKAPPASAITAIQTAKHNGTFRAVDAYIKSISADTRGSVDLEALSAVLMALPSDSPLNRLRAIYMWIASNIEYDVEALLNGNLPDPQVKETLKRRKAVCEGYSNLFHALCSRAGITCWRIGGDATPQRFMSGELDELLHAWNAAQIDGNWYLIDSCWGSGFMDANSRKFQRRVDDFFFCPPPSLFAFSHLPNWQPWQLLEKPISKELFKQKVSPSSQFFEMKLSIISHPLATVNATFGDDFGILIGCPSNVMLSAQLQSKKGNFSEDSNFVIVLNASHILQTGLKDSEDAREIKVSPPEPGDYTLVVFAAMSGNSQMPSVLTYHLHFASGNGPVAGKLFPRSDTMSQSYRMQILHPLYDHIPRNSTFRLACSDVEQSSQFALRTNGRNAQLIRFFEDELGHFVADAPNGTDYSDVHMMVNLGGNRWSELFVWNVK